MNTVIVKEKADLVVVARQFLADPDWPRKARSGCAGEIIRCIRCEGALATALFRARSV